MKWHGTTVKLPDAPYYLLASGPGESSEVIEIMLPAGTYTPGIYVHILRRLRSMFRFLFPFRIHIKRR